MRTIPPRILPGCVYCNFDHDPAIECRFKPSPNTKKRGPQMTGSIKVHADQTATAMLLDDNDNLIEGVTLISERAARRWLHDHNVMQYFSEKESAAAAAAPKPKFVHAHESVLQGNRVIARAISKTMAKRIANALNHHTVNSEGV